MVIPEDFKKDVNLAVEYLKTLSVAEIYLFGSVVKGTHTEMSDLDIAVRGIEPLNFFLAVAELQSLLEHGFDLVNLDFKDEFTENLEKSGEFLRVS
jgi:predicted nucleotidyltransferase